MGTFSDIIEEATIPVSSSTKNWKKRIQFLLFHRWRQKLSSLALVCLLWLLFAGQQNFRVTFPVYLNMKNIPTDLELIAPVNQKLEITVEGLRKDASTLSERNVYVEIDLSRAGPGKRIFTVSRDLIFLPTDRVHVVNISPPKIEFQFKKKPVKNTQTPDQESPPS
jgi:hypothetical protein